MIPDANIKVRFRTTEEGGRSSAILGEFYACPFLVDGEAYDCRLLIGGLELELGKMYEIPVKFLNSKIIMPKLAIGKKFALWEGRVIAEGVIISLNKS